MMPRVSLQLQQVIATQQSMMLPNANATDLDDEDEQDDYGDEENDDVEDDYVEEEGDDVDEDNDVDDEEDDADGALMSPPCGSSSCYPGSGNPGSQLQLC